MFRREHNGTKGIPNDLTPSVTLRVGRHQIAFDNDQFSSRSLIGSDVEVPQQLNSPELVDAEQRLRVGLLRYADVSLSVSRRE